MPKWPILLIAVVAGAAWWRVRRLHAAAAPVETAQDEAETTARATGAMIDVAMGAALAERWRADEAVILDRIASLRAAHEGEFGVAFPAVKLLPDQGLGTDDYAIRLLGARYGSATVLPDQLLAIAAQGATPAVEGVATTDPAFGLPAWWIAADAAEAARGAGCSVIDPVTMLVTHLGEVVRAEIGTLMTRAATVELLDGVRARQPGLVEELIPDILAVPDVQRVLQNLLSEGVSIAQTDRIVEHLTDLGRTQKDPAELTELVRQRMAHAICNQLRGRHPDLAVLSIDPRIENQITTALSGAGGNTAMPIDPRLAEQIVRRLAPLADRMFQQGRSPVLLCAAETRRALRTLTRRAVPRLSILSVQEIPMRVTLKSFDVVRLEN